MQATLCCSRQKLDEEGYDWPKYHRFRADPCTFKLARQRLCRAAGIRNTQLKWGLSQCDVDANPPWCWSTG